MFTKLQKADERLENKVRKEKVWQHLNAVLAKKCEVDDSLEITMLLYGKRKDISVFLHEKGYALDDKYTIVNGHRTYRVGIPLKEVPSVGEMLAKKGINGYFTWTSLNALLLYTAELSGNLDDVIHDYF